MHANLGPFSLLPLVILRMDLFLDYQIKMVLNLISIHESKIAPKSCLAFMIVISLQKLLEPLKCWHQIGAFSEWNFIDYPICHNLCLLQIPCMMDWDDYILRCSNESHRIAYIIQLLAGKVQASVFLCWVGILQVLFLSGNIILPWVAWSWCCLAVAAFDGCYMVKSSISIRDDGIWYSGTYTEVILITSPW